MLRWRRCSKTCKKDQAPNGVNDLTCLRFVRQDSDSQFLASFSIDMWSKQGTLRDSVLVVPYFMKHRAPFVLNKRILLKSKLHKLEKEGLVTSFWNAVNCVFEVEATDNVTNEPDADMMQFLRASNKSPTVYTGALWNEALRCDRV